MNIYQLHNNTFQPKRQCFIVRIARTHNRSLAKVAVQCSAGTFVVNQTLVLRMNICGKNRHIRQAANRYRQVAERLLRDKIVSRQELKFSFYPPGGDNSTIPKNDYLCVTNKTHTKPLTSS